MSIQKRVEQLERSQQVQTETLIERLSWVLDNPKEAALSIGAQAVARVIELIEIARSRKEESEQCP